MEAVAKTHHRYQPLPLSLHHHRPSFSRPISSLPFRTPPPPPSPSHKLSLSIRASSSSSPSPLSSSSDSQFRNPKTPKPQFTETLNPLKTAAVAGVAAAAVFFARFNLKPLTASATTAITPPPAVEMAEDAGSGEEGEKALKEDADSNPEDFEALEKLLKEKVNSSEGADIIRQIEEMIRMKPRDTDLLLLKSQLHLYANEFEKASLGYLDVLEINPLSVEAYHGLLTVAAQSENEAELKAVEASILEAMVNCRRMKKKDLFRDFKHLIAQILVLKGDYDEALKSYQDLAKEEPRDFRPYLCQGMIYTFLGKEDEAAKQFEKYQRLFPRDHPYQEFFDHTTLATKLLKERVESKKAEMKG